MFRDRERVSRSNRRRWDESIFYRMYTNGMSASEIAVKRGVPESHVRCLLDRAIRRRQNWNKEES